MDHSLNIGSHLLQAFAITRGSCTFTSVTAAQTLQKPLKANVFTRSRFQLILTPSKNVRLFSFTLFLERSVLILIYYFFLTTSTSLCAKGAVFLCKCIGDAFRCNCDGLKAEKRPRDTARGSLPGATPSDYNILLITELQQEQLKLHLQTNVLH